MASPHPPYSHPGPGGPSSYYQPSPPPSHHVYGSHSPGPGPNYQYQYPPPPPTHMGPHHPGGYPQPSPSRSTGRGGSYSRAAHNYHGYHQQPHHQSYSHPPHSNPHPIHAPHPQPPPQHGPYSPHPTKYNQPYPTSYAYPHPPPQAAYSPSWQSSQPLSPLPKQLSMPPPQNVLSVYSEPPPAQQSEPADAVETPAVKTPTSVEISVEPISAVEPEEHDKPPTAPSSPPPSSSPVLPQSSSYSQVGTINTSDSFTSGGSSHPPTESSSSDPSSPPPASVTSMAPWAIWSRRPQDPSHAPSIIISPRARPPPEIVDRALNLRTPPPSPPVSPVTTKKVPPPAVEEEESGKESLPSDLCPEQSVDEEPASTAAWSSETNSTVPSSAATETAYTPTVPGSPATTNTSVSVAGTPAKEAGAKLTLETANGVVEEPESKAPAAADAPAAPLLVEEAVPSQPTPEPAPAAAATPAIPPPKKSWASLLRPASSTSAPIHTKNALPTSSVVGFSIPASASSSPPAGTSSTTTPQQHPVLKSELAALLTHNPTSTLSAARIRSRGIVNSGNMCFANSVLQILVYCAPFHQLFVELGRVMPEPVVGKENQREGGSLQPLVAATVAFLKEFKGKDGVVVGAGARNGNGNGNGSVGKKGKEREAREEDDWDGDSFLPSYVYDAMKEKKRFDNMRGGHQEDAEEFLGFYLDTLEEELLSILHSVSPSRQGKPAPAPVEEKEEAAPPEQDGWLEVGKRNRTVVTRTIKATESPITRIFGGKFRSTLRAPRQKDSVIVEDWRSLRLDIQREQIHTIQDALSYISHPQPVQVTHPSQPGITIDATQQVLIDALPPILILHIKRFCYDTSVGGVVKVGKQVLFGPELEIGPDLMSTTVRKSHPTKYKLFGALYHHGHSASGGHYTLDVLHPNRYPKSREGWVRIDDELVSDVRYEDVFGASERDDSRCAYLLFYRRI